MRRQWALLLLLVSAAPAAAEPPDSEVAPTITVLAASSLAGVLPRLAQTWPSSSTARVVFSFDSSGRLAKQALAGVGADALVTADNEWMDHVERRGGLDRATRRVLAGNRLVVVVPVASKTPMDRPKDLLGAAVSRLALAGESVPAGRYARAALEAEGLWAQAERTIVRGDSVRSTLRLAALNEADAAIVYSSDAAADKRVRVAFTFPERDHAPIVYPAAVLTTSRAPAPARAFLEYCASLAARPVWRSFGFTEAEH